MNLTKFLFWGVMIVTTVFISCEPYVPVFPDGAVEGFRPIYENDESFLITKESGRDISQSGKIYYYGDLLLVNEVGKGIHVVDNSNPREPNNLYFISIPGNTDMAIRDDLIYANNMSDLAVIDVSGDNFSVVQRLEGLFLEDEQQRYPPGEDVYFECVDETQGRVIGWRSAIIDTPECYKR